MSRPPRAKYLSDPDNQALVRLLESLAGFGFKQAQVADHLTVTPSHLARVKSGERHAKHEHVEALQLLLSECAEGSRARTKAASPLTTTSQLLGVDHVTLKALTTTTAVEAFRGLLWARATQLGLPKTRISISSNINEADGGIDASILEGGSFDTDDELLTSGTRFQIKTGDARPWQSSYIRKELFSGLEPSLENLGGAVQETLRSNNRYVLVCFGVDPVDSKLRTASSLIRQAFAACGFPDAEVEVWGQTQLLALFNDYPSLCLKLRGHDFIGFLPHSSWSKLQTMLPPAHYSPELAQDVIDLRNRILSGDTSHVRVLGEPGIGKTRLALEITKDSQLAPITLYVPDGRQFLASPYINELVASDCSHRALLVVDECNAQDKASIWNALKSHTDRIKLITIDHGPDDSADTDVLRFQMPRSGKTQIEAILREYGIEENDAFRWADFCEGCPRVAHMLGENLREDRANLLQPLDTEVVWDRFIAGRDNRHPEEVILRRIVLRQIALFERFGYEPPVQAEAQFIAQLAGAIDPRITWGRFNEIVCDLRERRILQGAKTLYITPRLLHIYLFRDYWNHHGAGCDVSGLLAGMPPALWRWFVNMLRFAHDTQHAEFAVKSLLGPAGMFESGSFPEDAASGLIVDVLAETCPEATLRCLERTVGQMSIEQLRAMEEPRQRIVWALEKIAVHQEFFADAADVLLRLAEAENATNSNNATGTLLQLFSLIPRLAVTQAPPTIRLPSIRRMLRSSSAERRRLGVEACKTALDTSSTTRTVGPEHQGLRKTLQFWMPDTYGELWEAHREVWNLLLHTQSNSQGSERAAISKALVSAAWHSLHIPTLTDSVLDAIERLAKEDSNLIGDIVSLCQAQLRHEDSGLPEDAKRRLGLLCNSLSGSDLHSRLLRWIKHVTHEDTWGENNEREKYAKLIQQLAKDSLADISSFVDELPWLISLDSSAAFCLAFEIGRLDEELAAYGRLLDAQGNAGDAPFSVSFLSGYLAAIFARDVSKWEFLVLALREVPSCASRFSDLVISSGMSRSVAAAVVDHCRNGKQELLLLERWWFDDRLRQLPEELFLELVTILLSADTNPQHWSIAIHFLHSYYLHEECQLPFPSEMIQQALINPVFTDRQAAHSAGYYWGKLANHLVAHDPARAWDLFRAILDTSTQERSTIDWLDREAEGLLTRILRQDPARALGHIAAVLQQCDPGNEYAVTHWLNGGVRGFGHKVDAGPIQFIPSIELFEWVDRDPESNLDILMWVLPKTLDNSVAGRLTRDFIARYGADQRIQRRLLSHFSLGGFYGDASTYHRSKRDTAREWLIDEDDENVIKWVRLYLNCLNQEIERAALEEERERW
jgi:hypothetical protein